MAKDRNGSVKIYGSMQANTAEGIVAYTDGIAHEYEDGTKITLDELLKNGVGGDAIIEVVNLPLVDIKENVFYKQNNHLYAYWNNSYHQILTQQDLDKALENIELIKVNVSESESAKKKILDNIHIGDTTYEIPETEFVLRNEKTTNQYNELVELEVGGSTWSIPQTDFALRDEITDPNASYLSELQIGSSVWQIPNVDFILRDVVSEDTTQELKEIEINGDKWKVSLPKEEINQMIADYITANFENIDKGEY